eukprot:2347686-Rhodomonas_salina.1
MAIVHDASTVMDRGGCLAVEGAVEAESLGQPLLLALVHLVPPEATQLATLRASSQPGRRSRNKKKNSFFFFGCGGGEWNSEDESRGYRPRLQTGGEKTHRDHGAGGLEYE